MNKQYEYEQNLRGSPANFFEKWFIWHGMTQKKVCTPGDEAVMKIHKNYFLVYQLISQFLVYLQNYKEFEAEILDLQSEKYGLSFDIKKYYYFRLSPRGWECDRHKGL